MKKLIFGFMAVCVILGMFTGCIQKPEPIEYDLDVLSQEIQQSGAFSDILSPITKEIAASFYGFAGAEVTACVVLCSTGATTEEIALFKCADEQEATKLKVSADKRVETQRIVYESYAPGEMPKLDDAIVTQNGLYVFYIVSADAPKVQAVLDNQNK